MNKKAISTAVIAALPTPAPASPRTVGRPNEGRSKLVNFKTTPENAERFRDAAARRSVCFREWVEQACERQLMSDSLAEAREAKRARAAKRR